DASNGGRVEWLHMQCTVYRRPWRTSSPAQRSPQAEHLSDNTARTRGIRVLDVIPEEFFDELFQLVDELGTQSHPHGRVEVGTSEHPEGAECSSAGPTSGARSLGRT